MNRREQLFQQCEDDIFSLLMLDYAEQEGARLETENQRLKQDPEAAIPDSAYQKGLKAIQRGMRAKRRRTLARGANVVLHRVAVAVLIGVLLFTTAFAISPAFREGVRNLVVSMTAESADLELVTTEAAVGSDLLSHYVFPDCPEGFELESQEQNEYKRWQYFSTTDGKSIFISVQQATDTSFGIDAEEEKELESIQINGFDGVLSMRNDTYNIVYADNQHNTFVQIICVGLSRETALELISNISYNEN